MSKTLEAKPVINILSFLNEALKNRPNQGFTLIELLVTIIIIGTLSAIALPSFLNQVSKARASEAKTSTGSILRAQQAYRYQTGSFSDQLSNLNISVQQDQFTYSIEGNITQDFVEIRANPRSDNNLNRYAGASILINGNEFRNIICESNDNTASGGNADVIDAGFICSNQSRQIE